MKKILFGSAFILILVITSAFRPTAEPAPTAKAIKWYTFEEAVALSKDNPKKMFIDVYTDWCGWCKKMDKSTFTDPKVAAYLNEHFYPVKFNAEQKESVEFKGHTLKFLTDLGRRGVHELAYALLDGRMGYPAFVYLDSKQDRISISPGYKDAKMLMTELQFIGEDYYRKMSYEDFKTQQ